MARLLWIVPAALLAIAPAPLPYGYYTLLRFVVCACAAIIAYQSFERRGWHAWTIALVLLAVIFNPFLPFHLTRAVWSVFNVGGAALLIAHLWFERERGW